jgi:hypothetical protein
MGFLWNVMLSFSNEELWEDDEDQPRETCEPLERINEWIATGKLVDLVGPTYARDASSGLDANLYGGGFKHLDINAFIKVVETQPWKEPRKVQLWVMGGQEGMGEDVFHPVRLRVRRAMARRKAGVAGGTGEMTRRENAIFDELERMHRNLRGRLYRDGIPSPEVYLKQPVRVVFVFREPNLGGRSCRHDMRDEVRDEQFRPLMPNGTRPQAQPKGWWNWKAGMFAHAVAAALGDEPWRHAFKRFHEGGWTHDVVNRFGYVQIKKIGGGGTSKAAEIRSHAEQYADTLRQQLELYRPHLVIGGGVGSHSPAALLAKQVLIGGTEKQTKASGATWWEFGASARPRAMVQLWHPARRGSMSELYKHVWSSVREVVRRAGLRG